MWYHKNFYFRIKNIEKGVSSQTMMVKICEFHEYEISSRWRCRDLLLFPYDPI